METSQGPVVVGLVVAGITSLLYYPAVVAVGLLFYFAATPPPPGPLPSETRLPDAAFHGLSYPSRESCTQGATDFAALIAELLVDEADP